MCDKKRCEKCRQKNIICQNAQENIMKTLSENDFQNLARKNLKKRLAIL